MIKIVTTSSSNPDFQQLAQQLDAALATQDDPEAHEFYSQFNTLTPLKQVVLIYEESQAIACGAIKEFDSSTMEIKRMFTLPSYRKKGYAARVLNMLELWTTSMQKTRCVLETGKHQAEALRLYLAHGYTMIPNYGQYIGIENSICLEKKLVSKNKINKQNPPHYKTKPL